MHFFSKVLATGNYATTSGSDNDTVEMASFVWYRFRFHSKRQRHKIFVYGLYFAKICSSSCQCSTRKPISSHVITKRASTTVDVLGLSLWYLKSRDPMYKMCTVFGLVPSSVQVWLDFSLEVSLRMVQNTEFPEFQIRWPTVDEM